MDAQALIAPRTRRWAETSIGRIGKRLERRSHPARAQGRKLLVLHLDGVPRRVLQDALREDRMPFLSRLVKSGAYHQDTAFWGSPASTPAFQAGLLYGLRHANLPAYHWWDRGLGREVRMNLPKLAVKVEERVSAASSGSLLENGGRTYLSLFQARASNELAMTSLASLRTLVPSVCSHVHGIGTVDRAGAARFIGELVRETQAAGADALRWVRKVGDNRHELQFMLNRFFIIELAWSLAWNRALIDMVQGVPAVYLVFGNFDEVAHRRGPFSPQAAQALHRADAAIEELYAMSRLAPEPYDVVVVTDHGHVDSTPFEQRTGRRLKDELLDPAPAPLPADVQRALLDGRGSLKLDSPWLHPPEVIESGNFAHVYLTHSAAPLEARELLAWHGNVLGRAVASPQIGIVAVRRADHAVAIIGGRVFRAHELDGAPLDAEFNRRAVADLLEELPHMPTAGDIVLFGEATGAGATVGFAWEFGSHGGLSRTETESMVLWPSDAPLDLRGLGHSVQLHQRLSEVYRS
jgi:hypothetical protein